MSGFPWSAVKPMKAVTDELTEPFLFLKSMWYYVTFTVSLNQRRSHLASASLIVVRQHFCCLQAALPPGLSSSMENTGLRSRRLLYLLTAP